MTELRMDAWVHSLKSDPISILVQTLREVFESRNWITKVLLATLKVNAFSPQKYSAMG